MPQAWMIREWEREQTLAKQLDTIYRIVDDWDDVPVDTAMIDLSVLLSHDLRAAIIGRSADRDGLWSSVVHAYFDPRIVTLAGRVRSDIGRFSRTPTERQKLLADLAVRLMQSGTNRLSHELNREEMEQPEVLFGAPSRVAHVALGVQRDG